MTNRKRDAAISSLVEAYLQVRCDQTPDPGTLPLATASFGTREVEEAIAALLEGQLTMGKRVQAFEKAWAESVGVRHAIMVNSGSSALLAGWTALVQSGLLARGTEVLVPAVGWSTSLFTVAQAGLSPVLIDVDAETLCVEGDYDRPLLAIHLLGNPSRATSPLLVEDAAAAHGAMVGTQKVGSRGIFGAFSFFFSHHLTTGEGGMVTTDDDALADACKSVRAHGWIRGRSDRDHWVADHPHLDDRFLFANPGYNLRPLEIAGAFGVHQVPRLEEFVSTRRENHQAWCARIQSMGLPLRVYPEVPGTRHAGFGFPILLDESASKRREQVCMELEQKGIATRPISGANLSRQPAFATMQNVRTEGPLPVANAVMERGFFVGQSHAFGSAQLDHLASALAAIVGG